MGRRKKNMKNSSLILISIFLFSEISVISFTLPNANVNIASTTMASAPVVYVDGNNVGDPLQDGSLQHPFGKIQQGIDNASAGDTVFVRKWHYYETIDISKSLNLVGEGQDDTIIDGYNTMTSGEVVHMQDYVDSVNLTGFTIQNARVKPYTGILVDVYATNVNIIGNRISGNEIGIDIAWGTNITITNNGILQNLKGIIFDFYCFNANASQNIITGLWRPIQSNGVEIKYCDGQPHNINVIGNNISNEDNGIYLVGSGCVDIAENTISNVSTGMSVLWSFNNTFYSNWMRGTWSTHPEAMYGYGFELEAYEDALSFENNVFSNNTIQDFRVGVVALTQGKCHDVKQHFGREHIQPL